MLFLNTWFDEAISSLNETGLTVYHCPFCADRDSNEPPVDIPEEVPGGEYEPPVYPDNNG